MVPDASGIYTELESSQIYDPQLEAYRDTKGLLWDNELEAWRDVWPTKKELIIFENGAFKNLPGEWTHRSDIPQALISIIDGGLLKVQGDGSVRSNIIQTEPIDLSMYTKMYIDIIETDSNPSYNGVLVQIGGVGAYSVSNTELGGVEIMLDDFNNRAPVNERANAYFGFYTNYAYYAVIRKISFME